MRYISSEKLIQLANTHSNDYILRYNNIYLAEISDEIYISSDTLFWYIRFVPLSKFRRYNSLIHRKKNQQQIRSFYTEKMDLEAAELDDATIASGAVDL